MLEPVTDTVEFNVYAPGTCVPLAGLSITGAANGTPGDYTFTAAYTPVDATPPFTYLWDNGDTTATSQRTLGVGIHVLTLTMTNCTGAQVTATHTILITETGAWNITWLPIILNQ